jgi:quercetin dioxygenase-like cupin family protein
MRLALPALLILASSVALGDNVNPGPVVSSQILSTIVTAADQPIVLPQGPVRLIVTRIEIAPGAALPVHKHPYQRYAYVLSGNLTVTQTDTGASNDYKPGEVVVEMVDRWHSGRSTGTDPVRLIVFDQVPQEMPVGSAATVLRDR